MAMRRGIAIPQATPASAPLVYRLELPFGDPVTVTVVSEEADVSADLASWTIWEGRRTGLMSLVSSVKVLEFVWQSVVLAPQTKVEDDAPIEQGVNAASPPGVTARKYQSRSPNHKCCYNVAIACLTFVTVYRTLGTIPMTVRTTPSGHDSSSQTKSICKTKRIRPTARRNRRTRVARCITRCRSIRIIACLRACDTDVKSGGRYYISAERSGVNEWHRRWFVSSL